MLTATSANIATNLAEVITDSGKQLVPTQNTLLMELTSAINNNGFYTPTTASEIPFVIQTQSAGTDQQQRNGTPVYKESVHDVTIENYVNDLKGIVSNHISFARSVVNQKINTFTERLTEALSSHKEREAEDFFDVKYYSLHPVFSQEYFAEVRNYSESKNYVENLNVHRLKGDANFSLKSYLMSGDTSFDEILLDWIIASDENRLMNLITEDVLTYSLSNLDVITYSAVNYLFYLKLANTTDLDLGMTIPQVRSKAAVNRDYFGAMLCTALNNYDRDIRNGIIFAEPILNNFSYYNQHKVKVSIYETSFAQLAEKGCGIEVIFGLLASTDETATMTVDALVEQSERCVARWQNTRSLYLISINKKRLDIFKQLAKQVVSDVINTEPSVEDEVEYFKHAMKAKTDKSQQIFNYIDQLELSEIDDLTSIGLETIAKIWFDETAAYFLLKEMNELLQLDDKMQPMEAALCAAAKYVTDYMLDSVEVA